MYARAAVHFGSPVIPLPRKRKARGWRYHGRVGERRRQKLSRTSAVPSTETVVPGKSVTVGVPASATTGVPWPATRDGRIRSGPR
jgi:hypothetical protein